MSRPRRRIDTGLLVVRFRETIPEETCRFVLTDLSDTDARVVGRTDDLRVWVVEVPPGTEQAEIARLRRVRGACISSVAMISRSVARKLLRSA